MAKGLTKKAFWSRKAQKDKIRILKFWTRKNGSNTYSKKLKKLFDQAIIGIEENNFLVRATNFEHVRVLFVKDYAMIYEINSSRIEIQTLWSTRQDPSDMADFLD